MTTSLPFTSVAKVNSLFWITSLEENEIGVTRRVLEDLEPKCASQDLHFKKFAPTTASEFLAALDDITTLASHGMLPIIHFDVHGSADSGIHIVQSGENVSWSDISVKLRNINKITGNNLCVVSCACFSFNLVSEIDINQTVPFFMLIAPEHEIAASDIEDNVVNFYHSILTEDDITNAHRLWFNEVLRVFHSEQMLAIVLAKYVNNTGVGKQRLNRKEALLTMAIDHGVPNNRIYRRKMRKLVKNILPEGEELINRYAPTFLAGKTPNFTYSQIKELVKEARAKGLKPEGPYS